MAKFHGKLGFGHLEETSPGVHEVIITEKNCKGDLLRDTRSLESGEKVNPNLQISNRFSVVGDDYAYKNFPYIQYISWNEVKWIVSSVELQRPRLILTVRGVYNG